MNGPESNMTAAEHQLLIQYKEVIREQDQQLKLLRREFSCLKEEHSRLCLQLQEQSACIQQLKDQNSLLKAQKSASSSLTCIDIQSDDNGKVSGDKLQDLNVELMQKIAKKDEEIAELVSYSNSIIKLNKLEIL